MEDLNVIDQFVATFSLYIDSGFGLLGADVAFLTTALVTLDITLAGLFWAMGPDTDVIAKFLKKVLYVGFFALLIGNFAFLADVVFQSFAGLGLTAADGTITADDIMKPGFVAATGFDAAYPLLDEISKLTGPIAFFKNIVIIAVLFLAWLITLHHHYRVQADDACGLRADPLCALEQDKLSGRTGAGQCDFIGHQAHDPRHHCRDWVDNFWRHHIDLRAR